jgi:hypothetical protein
LSHLKRTHVRAPRVHQRGLRRPDSIPVEAPRPAEAQALCTAGKILKLLPQVHHKDIAFL